MLKLSASNIIYACHFHIYIFAPAQKNLFKQKGLES